MNGFAVIDVNVLAKTPKNYDPEVSENRLTFLVVILTSLPSSSLEQESRKKNSH